SGRRSPVETGRPGAPHAKEPARAKAGTKRLQPKALSAIKAPDGAKSRTSAMDAKSPDHAKARPRVEDDVLVRGQGRYVADAPWPTQACAGFVRSPHACARIVRVDAAAALEEPGIVGVLTGSDAEGLGSIGRHPPLAGRGGKPLITPHRPALVATRAMHV